MVAGHNHDNPLSLETHPSSSTTAQGAILVVDDDVALAESLCRLLGKAGYDVTAAADGRAAIATLLHGTFDAIVSDIQMPDMDGIQLLRRVRERDLDVPVILMTGQPTIDSAIRAVEYGALRYISKPFSGADLISIVGNAVRLRRLARTKRDALELFGGAEAKLVGDRAGLEATFDRALGSMWMAYQPIVSLSDRRVFGYEALLRSTEPALPHPGAILDAAERLKRVYSVGRVVRDRVAEIVSRDRTDCVFFVNLHPDDLVDESLMFPASPLSRVASRVVLEITERTSLDGVRDVRQRAIALRGLGFRLAVDDLGAGYAGLTTFASLEPEVVKIDMSLIRGIDISPVKRAIVEKLTALAHELHILVIAEGIESVGERDALASLGCDLLQGYLFAKPGQPFPQVSW